MKDKKAMKYVRIDSRTLVYVSVEMSDKVARERFSEREKEKNKKQKIKL